MVEMKGTYERTAADKYDEFLTALGVNMLLRKAATASTPVMTVSSPFFMYGYSCQFVSNSAGSATVSFVKLAQIFFALDVLVFA